MNKILVGVIFYLVTMGCVRDMAFSAQTFNPGNILVVSNGGIGEFTLSGNLVQSVEDPFRPLAIYGIAGDMYGRVHLASFPFNTTGYIDTFNPNTGAWVRTPRLAEPGNSSISNTLNGDLDIDSNYAYYYGTRINILDFSQTVMPSSIYNLGGSEVSIGLDHKLYTVNAGSPQSLVRVVNPDTFSVIRDIELRDQSNTRIHITGIEADVTGNIYTSTLDGRIYRHSANGIYLNSISTGITHLNGIDISPTGALVAGSDSGTIVVTDSSLQSFSTFSVGGFNAYAGFMPIPEPGVWIGSALLIATILCCRRRSVSKLIVE